MTTLNVGAGQAYSTLAAAVAASHDGDVIAVHAGTYVNDFATINTKVTIEGVGGMANFVATVSPPNGKGILVTQTDVTIQNLSFSGAKVPDMNGAGIRYEGGNLTVIDSYFHDNQDGILANADSNGTIRTTSSEFAHNGAGDGYSHNIYVNGIKALIIDDSYFHDAILGHEIKSRALSTTITNSRIYDGTGTASYSIDLPNGGAAVIKSNVIEQGANSDNPIIIDYGEEGSVYAGSSLLIDGNTVVNDMTAHAPRMLNNATTVVATVSNNKVYGVTSSQIASGPATVSGTTTLTTRPTLDTSDPWLGGGTGTIFGTAGADTLTGTAGADVMSGAAGNDTYYVNNAGDQVLEAIGGGTDTVYASVSWAMAAGQEIEYLRAYGAAATSGVTLTGNELNNYLIGGSGVDVLNGGAGNDRLDGRAGADVMAGGAGNDIYYVDNAGDKVNEAVGGGSDNVYASTSWTMTAGQEIEFLRAYGAGATSGVTLTGNVLNNYLIGGSGVDVLNGGAGNDRLNGGAGADIMTGGAGNDIYYVDNAGDKVNEAVGGGSDNVYASTSWTMTAGQEIEYLRAYGAGATSGETLTGNGFNSSIIGGSGNDTLDGGLGNDTLIGGTGNDTFLFDTALGATNVDTISDFSAAGDSIALGHTVFTGLSSGLLSVSAFSLDSAIGAAPQIVYNHTTGALFYDSNGSAAGGSTQFATLSGAPTLTASNFKVV